MIIREDVYTLPKPRDNPGGRGGSVSSRLPHGFLQRWRDILVLVFEDLQFALFVLLSSELLRKDVVKLAISLLASVLLQHRLDAYRSLFSPTATSGAREARSRGIVSLSAGRSVGV